VIFGGGVRPLRPPPLESKPGNRWNIPKYISISQQKYLLSFKKSGNVVQVVCPFPFKHRNVRNRCNAIMLSIGNAELSWSLRKGTLISRICITYALRVTTYEFFGKFPITIPIAFFIYDY